MSFRNIFTFFFNFTLHLPIKNFKPCLTTTTTPLSLSLSQFKTHLEDIGQKRNTEKEKTKPWKRKKSIMTTLRNFPRNNTHTQMHQTKMSTNKLDFVHKNTHATIFGG